METVLSNKMDLSSDTHNPVTGPAQPLATASKETDKKIPSSVKTLNLSGDQIVIADEIPGVLIQGIQYYDLKNIDFINYNGMANLIDFIKSLLEKGVEVQFVNVNEKIKSKIKSIGLEHILNCV